MNDDELNIYVDGDPSEDGPQEDGMDTPMDTPTENPVPVVQEDPSGVVPATEAKAGINPATLAILAIVVLLVVLGGLQLYHERTEKKSENEKTKTLIRGVTDEITKRLHAAGTPTGTPASGNNPPSVQPNTGDTPPQ